MRKRAAVKTVTGLGWVGLYYDGSLGWLLSDFVCAGSPARLTNDQRKALAGSPEYAGGQPSDFYCVEITMRPLKDKRGRYIVKRGKRTP